MKNDKDIAQGHPEVVAQNKTKRKARKAVKKKYLKLYSDLRKCFFEHDPIGINFGSNTDEYDPEVGTIIPRLAKCGSQADVLEVVHQEFVKWFGSDIAGGKSRYEEIATDVWNLWDKTQ